MFIEMYVIRNCYYIGIYRLNKTVHINKSIQDIKGDREVV